MNASNGFCRQYGSKLAKFAGAHSKSLSNHKAWHFFTFHKQQLPEYENISGSRKTEVIAQGDGAVTRHDNRLGLPQLGTKFGLEPARSS